jgi:hypothetical protein
VFFAAILFCLLRDLLANWERFLHEATQLDR